MGPPSADAAWLAFAANCGTPLRGGPSTFIDMPLLATVDAQTGGAQAQIRYW